MTKRDLQRTLLAAVVSASTACSTQGTPPQQFRSPDEALFHLAHVVASRDPQETRVLFGSDGDYLLESSDPALNEARASMFAEMFNQQHALQPREGGGYLVVIGNKRWPFAVPLVKQGDAWIFDAQSGKDEIVARRLGENEFSALDVARTVYQAQRQYALQDWNGDGTHQYATRLVSSPGQKDGLYWPTGADTTETSPLGPAVARAANENYVITQDGHPKPFHGYYHKILYSPVQPGESVDALSKPGHYWLISTPAEWNESGVMTFASNERGWIYEKNLGPDFDNKDIETLQIDDTWSRVE
jgi:hypothetical protein